MLTELSIHHVSTGAWKGQKLFVVYYPYFWFCFVSSLYRNNIT